MEILPQLILNSIIAGSIYALLALGFNLIFGTVKFFDLGYGALTTVGGYVVFWFGKKLGLPTIPSVIIGVLVAGVLGFIIYKLVYQKLRERRASSMILLVASLGVLTLVQAIIAMIFSSQFQTLSRSAGTRHLFHIGTGVITDVQVIIFASSIIIMVGLGLLLKFTTLGKAIRAIGDDEEVSKVVGINTTKIIGYVFFIGSAIAGLAGILVGFDTGIEPVMGLNLLLKGVIAAIIGGVGNVYGGVAGAFLLGFVENFGIWKIAAEWKDAIAFGVLILFLLFKPNGLFGRK